jgi:hypothetical protein
VQHLPVRLGVLGAARIALGGIIPAATRTGKVEIGAVGTRGVKKLLKIREPHRRPTSSRTTTRSLRSRTSRPSTCPCRTRCTSNGRSEL